MLNIASRLTSRAADRFALAAADAYVGWTPGARMVLTDVISSTKLRVAAVVVT
jgi:hypothetical protein